MDKAKAKEFSVEQLFDTIGQLMYNKNDKNNDIVLAAIAEIADELGTRDGVELVKYTLGLMEDIFSDD